MDVQGWKRLFALLIFAAILLGLVSLALAFSGGM